MNYHVVRMNETVKKISEIYNISESELKNLNSHIRNWEYLAPGLKLRLPSIPENLENELDDVEPFIEDYYPKLEQTSFEYSNQFTNPPKTEIDEVPIPVQTQEVVEKAETQTKNEPVVNIHSTNTSKGINYPTNLGYYYPNYYYPYYGRSGYRIQLQSKNPNKPNKPKK